MNYLRNEVESLCASITCRAVLAGDSILTIVQPMPDRSDDRSQTKYSSNQTSLKKPGLVMLISCGKDIT